MSIAETVADWAKELEALTGVKTIRVNDLNSTWVMDTNFEFVCTHDGSEHLETVVVDSYHKGGHDEYEKTIHVCDNCDKEIV